MIGILSRIKANPNRQALHNFDVIARGVFGRQQAEDGARTPCQALHVAA